MSTLASKVILITSKKEAQEKEKEARKEIRSKREKKETQERKKGVVLIMKMKGSGHGVAAQGTLLSICCQ